MTRDNPVDADRLREHAWYIDMLWLRLVRARIAVAQIGEDQAVFGRPCGTLLDALTARRSRHSEIMGILEENLVQVVRWLREVATGRQQFSDLRRDSEENTPPEENSLVADPGAPPMKESMNGLLEIFEALQWIEPQLIDAAPVAEFATPIDDLHAALRTGGLECLLDRVEPLRRMLDDLVGTPEVVASRATLWSVISTDLEDVSRDLRDCLDRDFLGCHGQDVENYMTLMSYNVEGLAGTAATAQAMALITRSAGNLILLTRDIVRGVIGDLAAQVILWSTGTAQVVTSQVMTARLATVVTATWRIQAYLDALMASMTTLSRCLDDTAE